MELDGQESGAAHAVQVDSVQSRATGHVIPRRSRCPAANVYQVRWPGAWGAQITSLPPTDPNTNSWQLTVHRLRTTENIQVQFEGRLRVPQRTFAPPNQSETMLSRLWNQVRDLCCQRMERSKPPSSRTVPLIASGRARYARRVLWSRSLLRNLGILGARIMSQRFCILTAPPWNILSRLFDPCIAAQQTLTQSHRLRLRRGKGPDASESIVLQLQTHSSHNV